MDHRKCYYRHLVALSLLLLSFSGCASNPSSGKKTSEQKAKQTVATDKVTETTSAVKKTNIPNRHPFLKPVYNAKVKYWTNYFSKKEKARFQRFINRGEAYRELIEQVMQEHGLPKELYYVGMIESGYALRARSHAHAVGPWQFIRSTARRYGLRIDSHSDERKNIYKSTRAAALYFRDLYNIFNSWELVLSAYNAGENGIIRRIRKANTRDYYQLSKRGFLPRETINYVPKVLAAKRILENPKKYGFKIPKNAKNPFEQAQEFKLTKSMKISTFAKLAGTSYRHIKRLNPDLKGYYTPNINRRYKSFSVRIPKNVNITALTQTIQSRNFRRVASRSRQNYRSYTVNKGDNLYNIARNNNITLRALLRANNMKKTNRLLIGQKLRIPQTNTRPIIYTVKRGDHLKRISKLTGVSIRDIMKHNKLRSTTIYPGQKLTLPSSKRGVHIVKRGEYLEKIANLYNMSVANIKNLNAINTSRIYPGQKLVVDVN